MKIKFLSNRPWSSENKNSFPEPSSKNIPDWYVKEDRYAKQPNGEYYTGPDGGKIVTWKGCPAIYDILITGYMLKTPCDIEFINTPTGQIHRIYDIRYQDFIQPRLEMSGFDQPDGYSKNHFAWYPDWAPEVPSGYSVLYSQPFNRFDLPFLNTTGIVDNDEVSVPGTVPFFIKEGWEGVVPAGTPYIQLLPFKRDDWESEHELLDEKQIVRRNIKNSKKYRVPNGGVYLNEVWHRRKYQ